MSIGPITVEFLYQSVNTQFKAKYIPVKNITTAVLDNYLIL